MHQLMTSLRSTAKRRQCSSVKSPSSLRCFFSEAHGRLSSGSDARYQNLIIKKKGHTESQDLNKGCNATLHSKNGYKPSSGRGT
eukprot:6462484-Amphidinium_carterae.1